MADEKVFVEFVNQITNYDVRVGGVYYGVSVTHDDFQGMTIYEVYAADGKEIKEGDPLYDKVIEAFEENVKL